MKKIIIYLVLFCPALTVLANGSSSANDSALLKKINKLESRVDSHNRELTILKKKHAEMSNKSSQTSRQKSSAPQKAVVTRRGSKQVVFE